MNGPLIVQSDLTVLLEVAHPDFEAARECLSIFAELIKSPEHIHTYRITPLSLWNASSAGHLPQWMLERLDAFSRFPVPGSVRATISDYASRYGKLALKKSPEQGLVLEISDPVIFRTLDGMEGLKRFWSGYCAPSAFRVPELERGRLKQALIRLGYPVLDLAGYTPGAPLPIPLRSTTRAGLAFALREYQERALAAFLGPRGEGASGVVTLPCGAGKTVVAIGAMARLGVQTLILATNVIALRQWRREILDKTDLPEEAVGEYSGDIKKIRPVTLATYQIVTYAPPGSMEYPHFGLFNHQDWGLIIYDEVHLLPAPIFQITALLQAKRRLGLTATLVREDGREDMVFSLIGPKKFDLPWKLLEEQGWIAKVECFELRVPFPESTLYTHAASENPHERFRLASENELKEEVIRALLERHREDQVLVIGQFLAQLKRAATRFDIPVLTGQTPVSTREKLFGRFREGHIKRLIVSSIANFALDLPDANCAIQISGKFGSRQEEAQRLGRILRPKPGANRATFYTLVTQDSEEQAFARHRQLFLAEQGYQYTILPAGFLQPSRPKPAAALPAAPQPAGCLPTGTA